MSDARPASSTSPLATADTLAEAGNWLAAVEAWQRAASEQPSLRPSVERRLEWFLAETGNSSRSHSRSLPLVLAFVAATALGMAFLMFAGSPGSLWANIWAVAAWIMIVAAVAASLLAARRSGETPLEDLVASARRAAERLDRAASTGEYT